MPEQLKPGGITADDQYRNSKHRYYQKHKERLQPINRERSKLYREKNPEKVAIAKELYYSSPNGVLSQIYRSQVNTSKLRGHNPPEYTRREFTDRFINDSKFIGIYSEWIKSGKNRYKKPSFDRIDDSIGYCFENIQLMTWKENESKGHYAKASCVLIYRDSVLIGEFPSKSSAARSLGLVSFPKFKQKAVEHGEFHYKGYKIVVVKKMSNLISISTIHDSPETLAAAAKAVSQ